jgi:hypothetical protein
MSSDPLARSDIWTEVPNEAEYDAVYAAVTATERGRWFLAEYASRNRHADTQLLVAAIARVEAAIDTVPPPSAALCSDLTEMAAAIGRVGNVTVADRTPAPEIGAAAERIEDIAAGQRERAIDAALYGALDAAAREICDVGANSEAGGERGPAASESPCNTLIAPTDYEKAFEPATREAVDRPSRFYTEVSDFAFHSTDQEANKGGSSVESEPAEAVLGQMPPLPGPQDDPADLFEPPSSVLVQPAEIPPAHMRIADGPAVLTISRPAPSDPLAGMCALSEEELIALFG